MSSTALHRASSLGARGASGPAEASSTRRVRTMPTGTQHRTIEEPPSSDNGGKFPDDAVYVHGEHNHNSGKDFPGDEGDESAGEATSDGTSTTGPGKALSDTFNTLISDDNSDAASEASVMVLMRYMGCSSKPYLGRRRRLKDSSCANLCRGKEHSSTTHNELAVDDLQYKHDLKEGDHVIQWKMLGYCYPIQSHGIVFSAGPDFVTIVDCSMVSSSDADRVGKFDGKAKKTRRRMNILTLEDEKEIKKWTKIRYGEEVQLKVHSANKAMQKQAASEKDAAGESPKRTDMYELAAREYTREGSSTDAEASSSAGLEMEEVERCVQAKIKTSPEKSTARSPRRSPSSWFSWSTRSIGSPAPADAEEATLGGESKEKQTKEKQKPEQLRLPKADPPLLVLARLRFLLEYGEAPFPPPGSDNGDDNGNGTGGKKSRPNLLPPHHLLYANSECIAVWCKTGRWSTLQAAIFLHSSTVGNAKQTATTAMLLSAKTVTVPASGFWGFFGGTTTVSLFTAQPWLVPALVGGGMVYIGLPTLMLWKAKGRWLDAEKRLNDAFWSMYDTDVIVELIRCWSGMEG